MHPTIPTHAAPILMTLAACAMLGFRHGFDYDHIAAIGDISMMQERPWQAMRLSLMYALGHAAMVIALAASVIGLHLAMPAGLDHWMERAVGLTLVLLALVVLGKLIFGDPNAPAPSRGSLLLQAYRWMRRETNKDVEGNYTSATAFCIGLIHGIGAETPSQLMLFLLAANLGGPSRGEIGLAAFTSGLLMMNTLMAASMCGFLGFSLRRPGTRRWLTGLTAAYSLAIGLIFLLDISSRLPSISG
jgi:high-affinity nickel-transport protein